MQNEFVSLPADESRLIHHPRSTKSAKEIDFIEPPPIVDGLLGVPLFPLKKEDY